jgi:hypothetical protein
MTIPQTEQVIIRLPANAARRLRRVAEIAHRSVDEVITETLSSTLPPLLEDVPAQFRDLLHELEPFSTTSLWKVMHEMMREGKQSRYDALLAFTRNGDLETAEREEFSKLQNEADRLMIRKAYAALLLKWRGERIPALGELEQA